jgi:sulfatase modifying factor 1
MAAANHIASMATRSRVWWLRSLCLPALLMAATAAVQAAGYVELPAGKLLNSVLASDASLAQIAVPAYSMRTTPVTNAEFRQFVVEHPAWQRGRVARTFSDAGYLRNWRSPVLPGDAAFEAQPVTNVSWFAAQAFCEDEGGRLPTWTEWEYSAASDATQPDARKDPAWLARILGWYARPASSSIPPVGGAAN